MSSCEDPRFSAPDLPFVGRPQDAWIYSLRHLAARSPHLRGVVVDAESLGEQLVVDGLRSVVSRCPESGTAVSPLRASGRPTRAPVPLLGTVGLWVHPVAAASPG